MGNGVEYFMCREFTVRHTPNLISVPCRRPACELLLLSQYYLSMYYCGCGVLLYVSPLLYDDDDPSCLIINVKEISQVDKINAENFTFRSVQQTQPTSSGMAIFIVLALPYFSLYPIMIIT